MTPPPQITSQRLTAAADRLPASPRVYSRLQVALRDVDVGIDEIVELVKVDASLASSVVRVSNSPVFRRGGTVDTLDEAINRIGLREVHRLVGVVMAAQLCSTALPHYGITADTLWENSVSVALAASYLASESGFDDRLAYTLGLLRPVGRRVLQFFAEEDNVPPLDTEARTTASIEAWEKRHFGATAVDISARLLAEWGFDVEASAPMRWHVRPTQAPGRSRAAALLFLACGAAEVLGKGLSCETGLWDSSPEVEKQAGVDVAVYEACLPETRNSLNRLRALVRGVAAV